MPELSQSNGYISVQKQKIVPPWAPNFIIACFVGVMVYLTMINCVVSVGKVKGPSMLPTYHEGDYFFVKAYKLLLRDPRRGEVVVLKDNNGYEVIKRVVLVPGDFDIYSPHHKILSSNEYVVLGDNRENSCDSREYGPVTRRQFLGSVQ